MNLFLFCFENFKESFFGGHQNDIKMISGLNPCRLSPRYNVQKYSTTKTQKVELTILHDY